MVVSDDGKPGFYALNLADGNIKWEAHSTHEYEGKTLPSNFSAALKLANGGVFAGSPDGMLHVHPIGAVD